MRNLDEFIFDQMGLFENKTESNQIGLAILVLASLVSSLADDALAVESEVDLVADELPLESCLTAVPLLGDDETVHVAAQGGLDFASVHSGDVLLDAGHEEDICGFDGRLGVHSDTVAFLKFIF